MVIESKGICTALHSKSSKEKEIGSRKSPRKREGFCHAGQNHRSVLNREYVCKPVGKKYVQLMLSVCVHAYTGFLETNLA